MKIIRDVRVSEKLDIGRATVWRKAKDDPEFPKPFKYSNNLTGWLESEVDDYIARKVAEYRDKPSDRGNPVRVAGAAPVGAV